MSHFLISPRFLKPPLCTLHLPSPAPSFGCQSRNSTNLKRLVSSQLSYYRVQPSPPGKNCHEAAWETTEVEHPLGNKRGRAKDWFGSLHTAGMTDAGTDLLPEKLRRNPSLVYNNILFPPLLLYFWAHLTWKIFPAKGYSKKLTQICEYFWTAIMTFTIHWGGKKKDKNIMQLSS